MGYLVVVIGHGKKEGFVVTDTTTLNPTKLLFEHQPKDSVQVAVYDACHTGAWSYDDDFSNIARGSNALSMTLSGCYADKCTYMGVHCLFSTFLMGDNGDLMLSEIHRKQVTTSPWEDHHALIRVQREFRQMINGEVRKLIANNAIKRNPNEELSHAAQEE